MGAALLTLLTFVAVRYDLLPGLRGPAPYPPEWQWRYRSRALSRVLPAAPVAALWVGLLMASGTAAARRRPRLAAPALVAGAAVLGLAWPLALLESEDGGALSHLLHRTASPSYLSYHSVARSAVASDPMRMLREYPLLLPALPLHAATHPPGPVLFFRGMLGYFADHPRAQRAVDAWILRACGASHDECGPPGLAPIEASAALAGALLAHAAAVATLVPIAFLAFALTRDRLAAARTAALWPLVPGVALFIPALDPPLAFPVTSAVVLLRHAVAGERSWSRIASALAAGAATAVAVYLSYGAPLFLLLAAAAALGSLPEGALWRRRRRAALSLVLAAGAALALAAVPMAFGHDPLASARTALRIHAEAYTAERSYALWLLYGPIDVAVFVGSPLVVALAAQLASSASAARRGTRPVPPARLAAGVVIGLALLFGSGVVRGEVGRLLVPLMPLVLVAAVARLDEEPGPDAGTAASLGVLLMVLDAALRLNWRL
jgi:hypothetical protein